MNRNLFTLVPHQPAALCLLTEVIMENKSPVQTLLDNLSVEIGKAMAMPMPQKFDPDEGKNFIVASLSQFPGVEEVVMRDITMVELYPNRWQRFRARIGLWLVSMSWITSTSFKEKWYHTVFPYSIDCSLRDEGDSYHVAYYRADLYKPYTLVDVKYVPVKAMDKINFEYVIDKGAFNE